MFAFVECNICDDILYSLTHKYISTFECVVYYPHWTWLDDNRNNVADACECDFHFLNRIMGVTGVEISAGLHWYLKYWCGSHISWDKTGGAQLFSVPRAGLLPRVQDAGIVVQRPIPWNYYQNAVSSSCKIPLSNCIYLSRVFVKVKLL